MTDHESRQRAAAILAGASRILVFTGAGISTDSGIPDFRGPNGVWTRNPKAEQASNIRYWIADAEVRAARWEQMSRQRASGRSPKSNEGHAAVAALHRTGRMSLLVNWG